MLLLAVVVLLLVLVLVLVLLVLLFLLVLTHFASACSLVPDPGLRVHSLRPSDAGPVV